MLASDHSDIKRTVISCLTSACYSSYVLVFIIDLSYPLNLTQKELTKCVRFQGMRFTLILMSPGWGGLVG